MKTLARQLAVTPVFSIFLIGLVSACQPPSASTDSIASGKVVTMGKQKLILQNESEFVFISLEDADRERLKDLKEGEQVTILGKQLVESQSAENHSSSSEINGVVRGDGTHIALGE